MAEQQQTLATSEQLRQPTFDMDFPYGAQPDISKIFTKELVRFTVFLFIFLNI
jgi:hypothetical protein